MITLILVRGENKLFLQVIGGRYLDCLKIPHEYHGAVSAIPGKCGDFFILLRRLFVSINQNAPASKLRQLIYAHARLAKLQKSAEICP